MPVATLFLVILSGCSDFGGLGRFHEKDITDSCHETVEVTVEQVVDGDTIDVSPAVELDGVMIERFRFLCIDTPESTTEHECYGKEASDYLKAMLDGETVELVFDVDCVGDYGRGLVYVRHGGDLVNDLLAREGYALMAADRYLDYAWCPAIQESVDQAEEADIGGWAECDEAPW